MRLSSHQAYQNSINRMGESQARLLDLQEQVSSGKKFNSPSDDPVAATRILQVSQSLALNEQHQKNIVSATSKLEQEEAMLSSSGDIIQRIRDLTLQAGSGVVTAETRQFIAEEVDSRIDELAGLLNSKDVNGEYLFAGHQGSVQPFQKDQDGFYRYLGDEGQRHINISSTTTLSVNDSGKAIFEDVASAQGVFITTANPNNTGTGFLAVGDVTDQVVFDAFQPEDAIIEFRPIAESTPPGLTNFTIRQRSDNRIITGFQNVTFQAGVPVTVQGMELTLSGAAQPGDTFFVDGSHKQGLLRTMEKFSEGLKTLGDDELSRTDLHSLLADTLSNLDNALTSVISTRSSVGARLNVAESTESLNVEYELSANKILSSIQDVDYAEAVSLLSFQSFVLQAAQQSFAKVSSISLFNYLR